MDISKNQWRSTRGISNLKKKTRFLKNYVAFSAYLNVTVKVD